MLIPLTEKPKLSGFSSGISILGIASLWFELDPTELGSIFLFCGHKKDRIKALIFEGDGWLLCYKRLTGDYSYQWPRDESEAGKLTKQQFRWLMEGLSIEQKKVIKDTKPDIY